MNVIRVGQRSVGAGHRSYIVGEIGINHNGNIGLAKQLIDAAASCGCDAVKFQKRTVDIVFSPSELARPRESPFGTTNGDLKRGLEFDEQEYAELDRHCRQVGIEWFASCWDAESVDLIDRFNPPCYKIASACLTDDDLLRHHRRTGRPILLSTGMSTLEEIDHAVDVLGTSDLAILHCTSVYPCEPSELNLRMIPVLAARYNVPVGYSGHEVGLATTVAAAALGACIIERHITMNRTLWGSDQAASVEVPGFQRLVRDVRAVEIALGDGIKRVYPAEEAVKAKLRRVGP